MEIIKTAAKNLLKAVLQGKLAQEEARNAPGKRRRQFGRITRQDQLRLDAARPGKIGASLSDAPGTRQLLRQQARLAAKGRSLLKPAG